MNSVVLLLSELLDDDSLIAEEYTENVPPSIAIGATIFDVYATYTVNKWRRKGGKDCGLRLIL